MTRPRSTTSRIITALATLIGAWYWMQIIHELGHTLAAIATGGRIERVVLGLFELSRTDVQPNPHPLMVTAAGPIIGAVLPVLFWLVLRPIKSSTTPLCAFLAGFCLVANGANVSIGSIDRVGDAGDLLALGTPASTLWVCGLASMIAGFWIWHTIGKSRRPVTTLHAIIFCTLALGVVIMV